MHDIALAALQWDPHIRGALIVLTAVLILPGSVYLLLATNTGARLGFQLAIAGLTGWLFLMSAVWMVLGIGLKGRANSWVAQEVITGDVSQSTVDVMADFPRGWKVLAGSGLADVQASGDQVLAPSAAPAGGHGASGQPEEPKFPPPFDDPTDYVFQKGWEKGGDNELFTIGRHKFYLRHSPHYAVVQVQPAVEQEPVPGEVLRPRPDPTKPPTTVVMLRDLGSLRLPPFILMLCTGTIFFVTCYVLHQRDKEIMKARAETATA